MDEKDFIKTFKGNTDVKINFVRKGKGGGGLSDMLWFMYFMWEVYGYVEQDGYFLKRLSNCFLMAGEEISTNHVGMRSIGKTRDDIKLYWKENKTKIEKLLVDPQVKRYTKDKHIVSILSAIVGAEKLD